MNASIPTSDLNSNSAGSSSSPEPGYVPHIVHSASVTLSNTAAGQVRTLLDSSMTSGAMDLVEVNSTKGQGQVPHKSPHEDRVLIVGSGCFNVCVDDISFEIGAGEVVLARRGVTHSFSCTSDDGGTLYVGNIMARGEARGFDTTPQVTARGNQPRISQFPNFGNDPGTLIKKGHNSASLNVLSDGVSLEDICTSPLCGPPLTTKQNEDTLFLIIRGRHEFCVGDARALLEPGDVVWVPRDVPHAWRALCVGPAHMIRIGVSSPCY